MARLITETRQISPSLKALYKAIEHRERLESILGIGAATQDTGIELYRHHMRESLDGSTFTKEARA